MLIYQITAPHMTVRFVLSRGQVVSVRGPMKFILRWNLWQVQRYCDHRAWRGWKLEQIKEAGGGANSNHAERYSKHFGAYAWAYHVGNVRAHFVASTGGVIRADWRDQAE